MLSRSHISFVDPGTPCKMATFSLSFLDEADLFLGSRFTATNFCMSGAFGLSSGFISRGNT